jgi:hypothetical protein
MVDIGVGRQILVMTNPTDTSYILLRRVYSATEQAMYSGLKGKPHVQIAVGEEEISHIGNNLPRLRELCLQTELGLPTHIDECLGNTNVRIVKDRNDGNFHIRRYWADFRDGGKNKPSAAGISINHMELKGLLLIWYSLQKHVGLAVVAVDGEDIDEGVGLAATSRDINDTLSVHSLIDGVEEDEEVDDDFQINAMLDKLKRSNRRRRVVISDSDEDEGEEGEVIKNFLKRTQGKEKSAFKLSRPTIAKLKKK